MSHRQQIIDAVKLALLQNDPQHIEYVAQIATSVVLDFPLDVIHYAKDDRPSPRIKEGKVVGITERTDGWKAR